MSGSYKCFAFNIQFFLIQHQILFFYLVSKLEFSCNTFIEIQVTQLPMWFFHSFLKDMMMIFTQQFLREKQIFIDLVVVFYKTNELDFLQVTFLYFFNFPSKYTSIESNTQVLSLIIHIMCLGILKL